MTSTDQIEDLWMRVEELKPGTSRNRTALGRYFHQLRSLYSDRQADVRRTQGHGRFEAEIVKRGYKPRTVREWINDYEAHLRGEPSSAAKRRARRNLKAASSTEPLIQFARLLPYRAAKAAYREAARLYHPDRGGNTRRMQQLNAAWERVQDYYAPVVGSATMDEERNYSNENTSTRTKCRLGL